MILRSFVPQAAACFTHGGFGSATDAVTLGAGTALTPVGADQFFNAYRLQDLRAGRVLPKGDFTVDAVRRITAQVQVDTVLEAGMTRLRDSFREAGGPAVAARAIEALLR